MWISIINGKVYKGDNIFVSGSKVFVDWKKVDISEDEKNIVINVTADIESLQVDVCDSISIKGNCGSVSSKNWSVNINGDVAGDVTNKNWYITCVDVGWNVDNKNWDIRHR